MFRKLISNLPFSPALIHDVGFYAARLRKEEATRRLSLLFVALTLVMQSLAVFTPPESANASSEQDIVRGGVTNLDDFLLRYDRNDDDLKDILNAVGINRSELAAAKESAVYSAKGTYILTRYGQLSDSTDEAGLSYQRSVGGIGMRYFSPFSDLSKSGAAFDGWVGRSAATGWFAVLKSNGSIITRGLPPAVNPTGSAAVKTVTATNLSQNGADATIAAAQPLDRIAYTVKTTNTGTTSTTVPFSINLTDTLEYATLIDAGGASFDKKSGVLSWPQVQLAPGKSEERTFAIRLLATLPATASGNSNPASFDCTMTVSFGPRLDTPVACPPVKAAESVIDQLPATGVAVNVAFAVGLLAVVTYFYARTRQLRKEIKIIRHNLNTGII